MIITTINDAQKHINLFLGYQLEDVKKLPAVMKFKSGICKDGLEKLILKGSFNSMRLQTNKPRVKIATEDGSIAFQWVFFKGGENSNDDDNTNEMGVIGSQHDSSSNKGIVSLLGFNLDETVDFNLTISCDDVEFTAIMNNLWNESVPLNSTQLQTNPLRSIIFDGEFKVNWAGYGGEVRQLLEN